MPTSFAPKNNQDSSSYRGFVIRDTLRVATDSVNVQISNDTVFHEILVNETDSIALADTIAVTLNEAEIPVYRRIIPVADVASVPSDTVISELYADSINSFPLRNNETLSGSLKSGEALPAMPFSNDWTIGVIIFSVILFSIAYASAKTFFSDIARFFLFMGIKEEDKKMIKLFRWESTLLNISSFFLISIFVYFVASYSNAIPDGFSGFKIWFFSATLIAIAITLRHIICTTTGLLSGATKVFNEYILTVYQSYRFAGFFLSVVIVLFFYTPLITAKSCLIMGCIIITILYLIRILRLFLLFINYKISILYFILYLCALEFLPVLVLIKYISGLI